MLATVQITLAHKQAGAGRARQQPSCPHQQRQPLGTFRRSNIRPLCCTQSNEQPGGGNTAVHAPAASSIALSLLDPDAGTEIKASIPCTAPSRVYQVSLKKPLGLTLTERNGSVIVDEVVGGGHAAQAGVATGDQLRATSARAQASSSAGAGGRYIVFSCYGESFKTVAAAIRSNTCSQCRITLVLEKPSP